MTVQKFRSIEEMNKAPTPESQISDFERFLRLCATYRKISPNRYPRGVFKFRSIEEAQAARAKYDSFVEGKDSDESACERSET